MSQTGNTDTAENSDDGDAGAPSQAPAPARLAVFDFDGTSIAGNSPVLLVEYLAKRKMLRKRVLVRIALWAIAYKLRLPQNESWVRGLVFTAFEGRPASEVDRFLEEFYDEKIAPLFRPQADAAMCAHRSAGDVVMVVSATFEPIVLRAMQIHPFDLQISTRMGVAADGTYTCEVEGRPVEGGEKLAAVRRVSDRLFGKGGWVLESAYGDHHSDRPVLSAARHAFAVSPDRPLLREARDRGWTILKW